MILLYANCFVNLAKLTADCKLTVNENWLQHARMNYAKKKGRNELGFECNYHHFICYFRGFCNIGWYLLAQAEYSQCENTGIHYDWGFNLVIL